MSLLDIITQYTKLAGQPSESGLSGLLGMAKSLLGNELSNTVIQQFLANLSPDILQKLSALKALGGNTANTPDSLDSFMTLFNQLISQFSNKQTDEQVTDLAKPESTNMIANALEIAKSLGIDLNKFM